MSWWKSFFRKRPADSHMNSELRFHLEELTDANVAAGMPPDEARRAYLKSLELDPHHAGAHLNLGRLLHEAGELREAEVHYRCALEDAGHRAVAAYNLGVVLEDQALLDEALFAYARAVEANPQLADAHHNLARLLERLGRTTDAIRHLNTYRRLVHGV